MRRIVVIGATALISGVALLGAMLLPGGRSNRAMPEPKTEGNAAAKVPEHPSVLAARGEANREELGPSNLTVEIMAEYRFFEDFSIGLLDPSTGKELDKKLATSTAVWSELAIPQALVVVTGTGWKTAEKRVPARGSVSIRMEPLSVLTGNVVDAGTGEPVEAFTLKLEHLVEPPGEPPTTFAHRSLRIEDAEGAFRLAGLPMDGNRLRLLCAAPGYLQQATDWLPVGAWVEGLVIELSSPADGLARVAGHVVGGPDHLPVADAQVLLVSAETRLEDVSLLSGGEVLVPPHLLPGADPHALRREEGHGPEAVPRSDAEGAFELRARASGEVRLIAFHPDWGLARSDPFAARIGERVGAPALVFEAPNALVVWLEDVGGPAPTSLDLEVVGPGGWRSALATGQEATRFTDLAPGRYRVTVSRGFQQLEAGPMRPVVLEMRWIDVDPEGETLLTIDLQREGGTSVAGALLAPDEERWQWQLVLVELSQRSARGASVLEDGRFAIENVSPGDYTLAAEGVASDGMRSALVWRRLRIDGSAGPPFLELSAAGRLEIHDSRLELASFGVLVLEPEEEALARLAEGMQQLLHFDPEGRSLFYGAPVGRVTIEREGRTAELSVTRPGEIVRAQLRD